MVPSFGLPPLDTALPSLKRKTDASLDTSTPGTAEPFSLPPSVDGEPFAKRRKPRGDHLNVEGKRAAFLSLHGVVAATSTSFDCHCGKTIQLVKKNNGRDVHYDQKTYRVHVRYCKGPNAERKPKRGDAGKVATPVTAVAEPSLLSSPSQPTIPRKPPISPEDKELAFLALPGVLSATPVSFECHCGKEIKLIKSKNQKECLYDRSNYWVHIKHCRGPLGGIINPDAVGARFRRGGNAEYVDSPLFNSSPELFERWRRNPDLYADDDSQVEDDEYGGDSDVDDCRLFVARIVATGGVARRISEPDLTAEEEARRSEMEDRRVAEEERAWRRVESVERMGVVA
ncbi:hypothetical protein HK101_009877 [Irineochytrium annulatum]|nr:hypothetical protein HK101_009877 [Irineochytrium annulatum]